MSGAPPTNCELRRLIRRREETAARMVAAETRAIEAEQEALRLRGEVRELDASIAAYGRA